MFCCAEISRGIGHRSSVASLDLTGTCSLSYAFEVPAQIQKEKSSNILKSQRAIWFVKG